MSTMADYHTPAPLPERFYKEVVLISSFQVNSHGICEGQVNTLMFQLAALALGYAVVLSPGQTTLPNIAFTTPHCQPSPEDRSWHVSRPVISASCGVVCMVFACLFR